MSFVAGMVVYILIWWVVLFATLPIGITRDETEGQGFMAGAPKQPDLKRKFILTSCISFVLWLLAYALIESDIISFRELAGNLAS